MPEWIIYVALSVAAVMTVLLILAKKSASERIAALAQELDRERARANAMAGADAQVRALQDQIKQGEAEFSQLRKELLEAVAARSTAETSLREASNRLHCLEGDLETVRSQLDTAQSAHRDATLEGRTATSQLELVQQTVIELRGAADRAAAERDQAREELLAQSVRLAEMEADRNKAQELAEQARQFVENARQHMQTTFTEAASKVFDEKAVALEQRINQSGEASKKQLEETLKPFNEHIKTFRERVDALNESQVKDNAVLVGAISELKTLNQGMASTTDALTRALKGNAKIRGNWGEMILESVLQASGLEEGTHFKRQASSKDEETGQRRQPDVVLTLPDSRQVVIDSKVNLVAWEKAHATDDAGEYHEALKLHAAALRAHFKDLAEKNYPKILGGQALDLTILFVPIEGALSAALSTDPNLQNDAWRAKVVFASPNTLMAMLQVVARLWVRDRLQKQVGIIGDEAGKLVDALVSFLAEFKAIEGKLEAVRIAYTAAGNRLSESPHSVLQRAKRLVAAGAKGRKLLPDELVPEGEALPLLVDDSTE